MGQRKCFYILYFYIFLGSIDLLFLRSPTPHLYAKDCNVIGKGETDLRGIFSRQMQQSNTVETVELGRPRETTNYVLFHEFLPRPIRAKPCDVCSPWTQPSSTPPAPQTNPLFFPRTSLSHMPKAITLTVVSLPQRAVSMKETSPKYSGVTPSLLPTSLERLVNQKSIFLETAENNFTPSPT